MNKVSLTKNHFLLGLLLLIILSCQSQKEPPIEQWKKEITDTELAFSARAKEVGVRDAFLEFAAPDGVIKRSRKILKGKMEIEEYYKSDTSKSLQWAPDFVDVSRSGDLGYTYGRYTFTYSDSLGIEQQNKGIFHTVWKRQENGTWKFVWD